MKIRQGAAVAAVFAAVAGCAGQMPQTAEEFRKAVPGAFLTKTETYPVGSSRTRIDLFGPSKGHDVIYRAINGWATGENLGCPDLTKIG